MIQRITKSDLAQLSKSQRQNLQKLWTPERYDIAVGYVCTNVETDEYMEIEFSIGEIVVRPNGYMTLSDLRAIDSYQHPDPDTDRAVGEGESLDYEDPIKFNKDDCLPLLSIGQLIDMLQSVSISKYHFYLIASDGRIGCEVGRFNSDLKSGILTKGYKNVELVDLLWTILKDSL